MATPNIPPVNTWKASGTGMTPLPPSPDIKPSTPTLLDLDPLLGFSPAAGGDAADPLHGENKHNNESSRHASSSRLRSIAKYQAFSPQALACSDPIITPSISFGDRSGVDDRQQQQQQGVSGHAGPSGTNVRRRFSAPDNAAVASLGAVAGAQGVAVFRMSKPHEPLLMLNHATYNNYKKNNNPQNLNSKSSLSAVTPKVNSGGGRPVTALAFQPDVKSSFYLAAARGSGVLVWDVSGHQLSPLVGRLAMDNMISSASAGGDFLSSHDNLVVTSLSWKLSAHRDGVPLLATTTRFSACIWDLRSPLSSAKPNIRFGVFNSSSSGGGTTSRRLHGNNNAASAASPYVQIACSRSHECATMDAAGVVRVFDIRVTGETRYAINGVAAFNAFAHAGVGISYLPMTAGDGERSSSDTAWVTWGLDSPDSYAVVKVWSSFSETSTERNNIKSDVISAGNANGATEDYWFMDGSPSRLSGTVPPYRLIAQRSPPYHLACPRVCPDPIENSIITIGMLEYPDNATADRNTLYNAQRNEGWRAELWKIRPPTTTELEANDGTFGMEKISSFDGGAGNDAYIGTVLGKNARIGQIQAAELAITSYNRKGRPINKPDTERTQDGAIVPDDIGLALCCLTDEGFVTTHVSYIDMLIVFVSKVSLHNH